MTELDPTRLLNLDQLEAAARERLPQNVYDYYAGGADDEWTLRANRSAFRRYALVPRVLVDVSNIDTSIQLLDDQFAAPIFIAPTAFQKLAHPDGELATVRAAAAARSLYIASTVSTCTIEEIMAAAPDPRVWLQLYIFRDRGITLELVQRAAAAGCRALCVTTTVPVQGKRERDARNRFTLPDGIDLANFRGLRQQRFPDAHASALDAFINREFDPSLSWSVIDWLAANTSLPIAIKGILHPDDARLAIDHGARAIIVSNHGGRQLDSAIATLDALPDIVAAVADRVPVLIDGGIRRGTDVIKAIALGAHATLIGRPILWGLAINGQPGVMSVLSILHEELSRSLALCGIPRLDQVNHHLLRPI